MTPVKGYKVFNPDWTCRGKKYTCPGEFEEEVTPSVCNEGMHFCRAAINCFNYYDFDPKNKVAVVIAHGMVAEESDKCCTDKLEVVREVPWDELLKIVNTGNWNTGNRNTGDWNTGNRNTGNGNTGNCNTGNRNTGNCNTGGWNTGGWNTGNRNTGNGNTGNKNTGNWNTGNKNTGNRNTGGWNTGNWNTGNGNTGNWNTGNGNTGSYNTGNWNTGCFMTGQQKIEMFNKPTNWSYEDWLYSDARRLLSQRPQEVAEWVPEANMTDAEKAEHPTHATTGGYLKVLNERESGQLWWDSMTPEQQDIIKALPNFNPEIFKQCTGIDTQSRKEC